MKYVTWITFIVFLVLKLTGVIGWSWWWVTSPLWIPYVWAMVVALFCVLYDFHIEKRKQ